MKSVVMNFSGIYGAEDFWKGSACEIDCTQISGTDCYLDSDAEKVLRQTIEAYPVRGVHFIDSGNTHYMTKLWTDRIRKNFSLVVFDHHSDMQPPAFEGILSCGSWVKAVCDGNPFLQSALLVGIGESSAEEVPPSYRQKVRILSEEECNTESAVQKVLSDETFFRHPLYVSIDKDVLPEAELKTNWDGGSLPFLKLKKFLGQILSRGTLLGVDICGEPSFCGVPSDDENLRQSNFINSELLKLLKDRV